MTSMKVRELVSTTLQPHTHTCYNLNPAWPRSGGGEEYWTASWDNAAGWNCVRLIAQMNEQLFKLSVNDCRAILRATPTMVGRLGPSRVMVHE